MLHCRQGCDETLTAAVDEEFRGNAGARVAERFQDALSAEELDPGLIHRKPDRPERRGERIREFTELLRSGIAQR